MAKVRHGVDWQQLRSEVLDVFTPGQQINELEMFNGRRDAISRLQDIACERGRNAIIYGEKGVGKTSLASVFHKDLNITSHQSGLRTRSVVPIHIMADSGDSFDSLWRKVFRRIKRPNSALTADVDYVGPIEPDHVSLELDRFLPNQMPIVVLDEYNRISNDECKVLMTDTIKALTLCRTNPTLVLVGVADNILQLVHDHESIAARNLVQVKMKRMDSDEIRAIITLRLRRLEMKISDDALWRIVYFSAGLPAYAHALGKFSALIAIGAQRQSIDEGTVFAAINDCMADVDYSIIEAYTRATERIYQKDNLFRKVLAACAMAETNDLGEFTAASVEAPLSVILGEARKVPSFAFHLNEMCGPERGSVLRKTGERRTYLYHFASAEMQPFVVMKSLAEEVISTAILDRFRVTRQRSLPI